MKAHWARAALLVAALPACSAAYGAPSADATTSLRHTRAAEPHTSLAAGRAAQPGSWSSGQASEAQSFAASGPSGQAAQPGSWTTNTSPPPTLATPLADDGPSYLGGRAGQPNSWLPVAGAKGNPPRVAGL
jgi:hypothetical protein